MNPDQRSEDPVKHVILLLFENHAFDQMLGCFKELYPQIEGIDPQRPRVNRLDGIEYPQTKTTERHCLLDPRHEVEHVLAQLADNNGNFVTDFASAYPKSTPEQRRLVMAYYPRDFLPALHGLAAEFTLCDHWFASVPGPTWPNRFFALCGTSNGKVNMPEDGEHEVDIKGWFQQTQDTLFDRLSAKGISWQVYFHDVPQSVCLVHQRRAHNVARYVPFERFATDAAGPETHFPAFSFIEPNYNGLAENDDHPPHDVMKAQKLLADIYNAVRANADLWRSTLLVVLYDEHGGFYDHVEPPAAVPPSPPQPDWEYRFDRLGLRVPALLVSPWVQKGIASTAFDHTSLLRYLADKWDFAPLGERAAAANSIGPLIGVSGGPRLDTVERIELTPDQLRPPNPDLEDDAAQYISAHHRTLALVGRQLELELLWESPLTFAWGKWLLESLLHTLLGLGNRWLFRRAHEMTKGSWQKFLQRRKEQAVGDLAGLLRHAETPQHMKRYAAETLALAAAEGFHLAADPVAAAMAWLKGRGR